MFPLSSPNGEAATAGWSVAKLALVILLIALAIHRQRTEEDR